MEKHIAQADIYRAPDGRHVVTRAVGWHFPRMSGVRRVARRGAEFTAEQVAAMGLEDVLDHTPYAKVLESNIAGHAGHPPEAAASDPDEYPDKPVGHAYVTMRDDDGKVVSVKVKNAKEAGL